MSDSDISEGLGTGPLSWPNLAILARLCCGNAGGWILPGESLRTSAPILETAGSCLGSFVHDAHDRQSLPCLSAHLHKVPCLQCQPWLFWLVLGWEHLGGANTECLVLAVARGECCCQYRCVQLPREITQVVPLPACGSQFYTAWAGGAPSGGDMEGAI